MYDLIGDIHGHADELVQLLQALGYHEAGGVFSHPDRQAIFVGDFIDRGPEVRRTLEIVRGMVDAGKALAVMGNHEINAIAFHTPAPDRPGGFLRPHTLKNERPHRQTMVQLSADELAGWLEWFRTLPLWIELPGLRAVHACWDPPSIEMLDLGLKEHGGVTMPFLRQAFDDATPLFDALETILKGPEAALPVGVSFFDKEGQERFKMRTRWYLAAANHSYRTYGFQSDEIRCDKALAANVVAAAREYPTDARPVFVGHYWLWAERPSLLAPNVACLDYSVAKGGFLTAYRWDGESRLNEAKFVTVK